MNAPFKIAAQELIARHDYGDTDADPRVAVDGNLERDRHWAGQSPSSLIVDLEGTFAVDRVILVTFSDGGRYYQYKIEGSVDGQSWTTIDDASTNTGVASPNGYITRLNAPVRAEIRPGDHAQE